MRVMNETPIHIRNDHIGQGVWLRGSYNSLYALYLDIHGVLASSGDVDNQDLENLTLLGLAYEVRHTFMGDRKKIKVKPEFADNIMASQWGIKETSYHFEVLLYWPIVLHELYVLKYIAHHAKVDYDILTSVFELEATIMRLLHGYSADTYSLMRDMFVQYPELKSQGFIDGLDECYEAFVDKHILKTKRKRVERLPSLMRDVFTRSIQGELP